MPMHDWKRVPATIYHHFHQRWTISICDALNAGLLPPGYSALVEQYSSGLYPDVLAVQRRVDATGDPVVHLDDAQPRLREELRVGDRWSAVRVGIDVRRLRVGLWLEAEGRVVAT